VGERRVDFVLSGAAMWPLLAFLAAAADGPARGELEHAIGLPPDRAMACANDVIEVVNRAAGAHGAIGLWVHRDLPLRTAWASELSADIVGRLRGELMEDRAMLDAWVKEHTIGIHDRLPVRLERLPLPLRAETLVLLAACLAIRTHWTTPFRDLELPFRPSSGPWVGLSSHALDGTFEDLDRLQAIDLPR